MIAEREVGDVSPDARPKGNRDVDWHEEPASQNRRNKAKDKRASTVRDDLSDLEEAETPETPAGSRLLAFLKNYWALHLCAAIGLIILANLSLWQFSRLDQKLALIERVETRSTKPPASAPGPATWEGLSADDIDYLPVQVTGQFIMGELFYFDTLNKPKGKLGGQGYFIYAPFITQDGWTVLVNRGFVPKDRKDFSTRLGSAPPRGQITISGLARRAEEPSLFSAEPNFESHEWYVREPKVMADAMGLLVEQTAPYTIDLQETVSIAGSLPQAGETRMTFSNNHLQYAFTWAGLALTLFGVYIAFLIKAWFSHSKTLPQVSDEDDLEEEEAQETDRYKMISDAARKARK